jgi:hypothetical protein
VRVGAVCLSVKVCVCVCVCDPAYMRVGKSVWESVSVCRGAFVRVCVGLCVSGYVCARSVCPCSPYVWAVWGLRCQCSSLFPKCGLDACVWM